MVAGLNSILPSASARGLEPRRSFPTIAGQRLGVALSFDDPSLEQALRRLVGERPELFEAHADEAAVVVTDRPRADDGFGLRRRVLTVGPDTAPNTLDSLDPNLILSATALLAAGYRLDRDGAEDDRRADQPIPHLGQRERQVAALLVDGASNKLIARQLDISVHTAKFHVTAIMDKLHARNRADVVAIVLREGLVAL